MSEFRTLLPPNATAEMRALERAMAEPKEGLHEPIATLWNVDTCPVHLLPWMAWAFSVETWEPEYPEGIKRDGIRAAIEVHRLKGTRGAVERALAAIGAPVEIIEWWENGAERHTFQLNVDIRALLARGAAFDAELLDSIGRAVDRAKPVRSQYSILAFYGVEAVLHCGAALVIKSIVEVYP